MLSIEPTGQPAGAVVHGIDLSEPMDDHIAAQLRAALDEHHVLTVPGQSLGIAELERCSTAFGALGEDPWFVSIEGSRFVAEVRRAADETTPIFAEGWHSDWSFLETPPIATCLYGVEIPPVGGDTWFANQHLAYERLPDHLRERVDGLVVRHTTRGIYGTGGIYDPERDGEAGRTMDIVPDREVFEFDRPLVRVHEGNGRRALYSTLGYIQGVVGLDRDEGFELLAEIHRHQVDDAVVYRHRWEPGMVVIWDNRSVLHRATGGYEGHARRLRRTTILPR